MKVNIKKYPIEFELETIGLNLSIKCPKYPFVGLRYIFCGSETVKVDKVCKFVLVSVGEGDVNAALSTLSTMLFVL